MIQTARFGVVGGYGSTGAAVVQELYRSCPGEINLGGRDMAKANALAREFDGRVSAASVDVLDPRSLERFCNGCSIIVNCGGPVNRLQDAVAQAAFRARCHYVDVAGMCFVKERMLVQSPQISALGLSFVVSAGWLPGITELLPAYTDARARGHMDAIDSLTIYYGDSGEWSASAFDDMAYYLRRTGLRRASYFRKGERVPAGLRHAFTTVDLDERIGRRRFSMFSLPELDDLGRRLNDCDFFTYSYLPSVRTALAAVLVALLPLPRGLAVRLLLRSFPKDHLPVGGFVVVQALGSSQGRKSTFTAQVVYDKHREYWINGVVAATVARLISEGQGVRRGVNFLADAVDPVAFMAELRKAGVDQIERTADVE